MLIACNNKGCMQHSNAMLNTETMEVVCAACNAPINNISESMKRALKSTGQILRTDVKKAFVMACRACRANREVVWGLKEETVCKVCKGPIQVHAAMKQAIKEFGEREAAVEVVTDDAAVVVEASTDKVKVQKRKTKKQSNE